MLHKVKPARITRSHPHSSPQPPRLQLDRQPTPTSEQGDSDGEGQGDLRHSLSQSHDAVTDDKAESNRWLTALKQSSSNSLPTNELLEPLQQFGEPVTRLHSLLPKPDSPSTASLGPSDCPPTFRCLPPIAKSNFAYYAGDFAWHRSQRRKESCNFAPLNTSRAIAGTRTVGASNHRIISADKTLPVFLPPAIAS